MQSRLSKLYPYLLILPALFLVLTVSLYPSLYSFWLSTQDFRRGVFRFSGLDNFQTIIESRNFWNSLFLTFAYGVLFVTITMVLGFGLALIFQRKPRGSSIFLIIIFIPWMLSEIVTGIMWRWMFLPALGVLQNLLGPLFGTDYTFLGDNSGAMGVVVAATIWRSLAYAMLLIIAGLQTVPGELGEAASIDGANGWQRFWKVTWPLVLPTTQVIIVFLSIQAINAVGMFLSITQGGPGRATDVLSLQMYREALDYSNFGYAGALGVIMFFINGVLAFVYIRSLRAQNAFD
jgi:ABC-type sugar transport system permease subunit